MRTLLLALLSLLAGCRAQLPPLPPANPAPALALPDPLRAVGTEPFWAAIVEGTTLTYKTPENQEGTRLTVRRTASATESTMTGTLGGAPLRLRVTRAECSDGMSDTVYPYTVELAIGAERRHGCARP